MKKYYLYYRLPTATNDTPNVIGFANLASAKATALRFVQKGYVDVNIQAKGGQTPTR